MITFIQNYKFNNEFEETSEFVPPCTEDAVEASFTKTRKKGTTVVFLTFNLPENLYNI